MSDENADKRLAVEAFLQQGLTMIVLDARQPGVSVPEGHRTNPLVLNLSHRFNEPCDVSAWGLRAVLSFDRDPFPVQIPWEALIAARAKNGEIAGWLPPAEPPVVTKRRGILGVVQ